MNHGKPARFAIFVIILGAILPVPGVTDSSDSTSAQMVLEQVLEAWHEGDAERLAAYFGDDRIRFVLSRRSLRLTPDQAYYVLEDYFRRIRTLDLQFERQKLAFGDPPRTLVLLKHRYRLFGDGQSIEERVLLSLRLRPTGWKLEAVEILSH